MLFKKSAGVLEELEGAVSGASPIFANFQRVV
jgi:hypothetical protein